MIEDLGIVIVAAGSSQRFGDKDKLKLEIDGAPLFIHCLRTFLKIIPPQNVVVVTGEERVQEFKSIIQKELSCELNVVCGGAQRSDSSLNGLQALPQSLLYAGVHDAARPYISTKSIETCYRVLKSKGSAVLAHPVTDTIKVTGSDLKVVHTPPRDTLYAAETPQMFDRAKLISAYLNSPSGLSLTDEAMAMEAGGHEVFLAVHEENNRKITYSKDLIQ